MEGRRKETTAMPDVVTGNARRFPKHDQLSIPLFHSLFPTLSITTGLIELSGMITMPRLPPSAHSKLRNDYRVRRHWRQSIFDNERRLIALFISVQVDEDGEREI